MRDFMICDFEVTAVNVALYVERGKGGTAFKNRAAHGIALNLSESRKSYVFSDGRVLDVGQNEIVYLPKGSSYTVNAEMTGECYAINFDTSRSTAFQSFVFKIKNVSGFEQKFDKAATLWKHKDVSYHMRCKAALYEILSLMQLEYSSSYIAQKTVAIISPAIEYIHKNYSDTEISITALSDMCGISEDYFRKIFKSAYGTSPVKYISDLKISYAKKLLASGLYTVARVAELSGFADTSYFSREFKKVVGVCPSEYM